MHSRTRTLVTAGFLAAVLLVLAATVPVPLIALGPGPTYDTLATSGADPVIDITGLPTYPTSGHMNMTTVSVTDNMNLFAALGFWISSADQVLPRDVLYPPTQTPEQVDQKNASDFTKSEIDAESAATKEVGLPVVPVVADVVAGTAADGVLRIGDRLESINGHEVGSPDAVRSFLRGTKAGDRVELAVVRDRARQTVPVTLGASSDGPFGALGVVVGGVPRDGDIRINLAGVGGPSAGLMFALAVVDKLTPGPLTNGTFVAGTGEIDVDGNVSKIGGIRFKMRAARDAGATVFLVPSDNCVEAAADQPDGLQLVRVATLHDAVSALGDLAAHKPAGTC